MRVEGRMLFGIIAIWPRAFLGSVDNRPEEHFLRGFGEKPLPHPFVITDVAVFLAVRLPATPGDGPLDGHV